MQIETLKIFCDLVETESFSKAAKINFISQSAVSQQIQALENNYNQKLIIRNNRSLYPTEAGKIFYQGCKEILQIYEDLSSRMQALPNIISGTVKISTVYSVGLHELPPYEKQFLKDYPAVRVLVQYRHANQVYEDVIHNASHLGIVAYPVKKSQIEIIPFKRDILIAICAPTHPFASLSKINIQDIQGQNFIAFERGIPTREALERIFSKYDVTTQIVMEFDNIETVKRAVEVDAGISIVPYVTVKYEAECGTLRVLEFADGIFERPIGILYKKGKKFSPAVQKFVDLLTKEWLLNNFYI